MTNSLPLVVIVLWVVVVSVLDLKKRTIPNYLSLGGVLMAMLILVYTGETANHESIASSLLGFIVALFFTVPGYIYKVLGGGDVKFLSAVGALLGFDVMLISFTIATSTIAVAWILYRYKQHFIHMLPFKNFDYPAINLKEKFIPFGSALGVSLILTLLYLNAFSLG